MSCNYFSFNFKNIVEKSVKCGKIYIVKKLTNLKGCPI